MVLYIRISVSIDTIKYISLHPDLSVWCLLTRTKRVFTLCSVGISQNR